MRKIALFLYFPCKIYKLKFLPISKRDFISFISPFLSIIHWAIFDGANCLSLSNVLIANYFYEEAGGFISSHVVVVVFCIRKILPYCNTAWTFHLG